MNTKHQIHTIPTMLPLRVTGAAARSVTAADEAGRAAHAAVVEIQTRMLAHEDSRREHGIDATWCAHALALIAEERAAIAAVEGLSTRWKTSVTPAMHMVATSERIYPTQNWPRIIGYHAKTLAEAGVPPITEHQTIEAWVDAAARGC